MTLKELKAFKACAPRSFMTKSIYRLLNPSFAYRTPAYPSAKNFMRMIIAESATN